MYRITESIELITISRTVNFEVGYSSADSGSISMFAKML